MDYGAGTPVPRSRTPEIKLELAWHEPIQGYAGRGADWKVRHHPYSLIISWRFQAFSLARASQRISGEIVARQ